MSAPREALGTFDSAAVAAGRRIIVSFRNDDPSASSNVEHERRIAGLFERYGIPQTIGVIPLCPGRTRHNPYDDIAIPLGSNPEMVAFLRDYVARSGSEIALHGYTHRSNLLSRPSRREYFEFRRLSLSEQSERIRRGIELVENTLGVRPVTFIPPWNRLDMNTIHACAANGIHVVSSGGYSPTVEDIVSYGTNCGTDDLPDLIRQARRRKGQVFLNVLYHSPTTRSDEEIAMLERALESVAGCEDCQALTLREAVQRHREALEIVNEAAINVANQDELFGSIRARAAVYRKLAVAARIPLELQRAYERARILFQDADYEAARGLSREIEKGSRRLVFRSRALVVVTGMASAMAVEGLFAALALEGSTFVHAAAAFSGISAGALAAWHATAPDTKREMWTIFLLGAGAWLVGAGMTAMLRAFLAGGA